MMDWSDRHCRFLHRQLSRHALLFTEMVTSAAILHGDNERLLGFDPVEQPVAVQLGGSDPAELARATAHGHDASAMPKSISMSAARPIGCSPAASAPA